MRWVLAVVAVAILVLVIWAAVPTREGDTIGDPGPGATEDAYDGIAHAYVENIDLRAMTARIHAEVTLDGGWQQILSQLGDQRPTATFATNIGSDEPTVEVPLQLGMSVSFDIPIAGNPISYPQDEYRTRFRLTFTAPDGVPLPTLFDRTRYGRELAIAMTFIQLDPNLRDWVLDQEDNNQDQPRFGERVPNLDGSVVFTISRSDKTLAYVYGIMVLPLLIVAGYLVATRRMASSWRDTQTSPLELAAALLAVITLRQVLIPPDIAGFTTLDKWLGIQVAAITAVTVGSHLFVSRGSGG